MYIVRDVFRAKAGKSKHLVAKFKAASPFFLEAGAKNIRILTDVSAEFWTVVWEFEIEEIGDYFAMSKHLNSDSNVYNALDGYQEYIAEGNREIFRIE